MPKRSRSGVVSRPEAGRRADQRERRQADLDRARRRPLADDQVELKILQRRIEDLLDRRRQAVDLVDEEHVALFEIGEQRREIAGLGDDRAGGGAEIDAELARDDLRQRRLAEARRADEEHVVERLLAPARRLDEHLEVGAGLRLADELRQVLRAQRRIGRVVLAQAAGDHAFASLIAAPPACASATSRPSVATVVPTKASVLSVPVAPSLARNRPQMTPTMAPRPTASVAGDRTRHRLAGGDQRADDHDRQRHGQAGIEEGAAEIVGEVGRDGVDDRARRGRSCRRRPAARRRER